MNIEKRKTFSWILYDFANTIYSMNVVTMYFPLWITVNLAMEDLWVSAGNSISMALVAVTMPVLGVLSDEVQKRMPFLIDYTVLCVVGTLCIGVVGLAKLQVLPTVLLALFFFIIANYAYQGGLVFYNALLPNVSTPKNMGKISGYGVAFGYIGAIVGLLLVMPFVTGGISFLKTDFPWLSRDVTNIASVEATSTQYIDKSVDRDGYYEYSLLSVVTEKGQEIVLPQVDSRDSVIVENGYSRRAVSLSWQEFNVDSQIQQLVIQRTKKGWGHVGSFVPTALLFLLFSLPIFVFIREKHLLVQTSQIFLKKTILSAIPAAIFLPFIVMFPVVVLVINPIVSRKLLYSVTKEADLKGVTGEYVHWLIALFYKYTIFINANVIKRICGHYALTFQKTVQNILQSLVNTAEVPGALRFLVAKYFYEEGIQTIIIFMAVYAVKVIGFSSDVIVPFFLVATTAAAIGSFFCGFLTDKIGPKRTLMYVILGWILCLVFVLIIQSRAIFWGIACFIGVFMGSTWTAARPLLITLVPEEKLGEFFGLYSLSGKAASIIGPLIWGIVVYIFGFYGIVVKYKVAVGTLGVLMMIGLLILYKVPDKFQRITSTT